MRELSIVIPCVSSASNVLSFIDSLAAYVMSNPGDIDCIVVGNERSQGMEELAVYVRRTYPWLSCSFLQRKDSSRSYGALARFGIAYANSQYVVLLSSSGGDDLSLIPKMLAKMRAGAQVAQATRFVDAAAAKALPLRFKCYQAIYRSLVRLLLGLRLSDSTYGFKMFDRIFVQSLGLNQNGYSICPEITFKALLGGGNVVYLPSASTGPSRRSDFRLYKEGIGYGWLLVRGVLHRLGILWF